jgi:hypothetical protein
VAISPLAGPQMPDELKLKYFKKLKFPDLQNAALVCKNWFEVSCDSVLWNPIFKELSQQYTCNEGEEVKSAALRNLLQDQTFSSLMILLIGNKEQLADIINCPLETIERFPTMLPIERTWHVMRGLRRDCTLFIKQFPHIQVMRIKQYILENPGENNSSEFYEKDFGFPLFFNMLKTPPGPFQATEAFLTVTMLCIAFSSQSRLHDFLNAYADIMKPHPDLSKFFEADLFIGHRAGGQAQTVSGAIFATGQIMPNMARRGIAVTAEDWIKCGYKPS